MSNVETTKQIYAAFGRGDVPAVLAQLASDVEWEYGVNSTDVPWLQPRRGVAQVADFFASLAALDIRRLDTKAFLQADAVVVVLVDLEASVVETQRPIVEIDEVHLWHFDAAGKVCRFRHRADTHQHMVAFHGG